MKQVISFEDLRLTNNKNPTNGDVVLNSLHKYETRLKIYKVEGNSSQRILVKTVEFPVTQFIAGVKIYNENVIKLKRTVKGKSRRFQDEYRGVVPGGARGTMASIKPISNRGANYAHRITSGTSRFSDLPTALVYNQVSQKQGVLQQQQVQNQQVFPQLEHRPQQLQIEHQQESQVQQQVNFDNSVASAHEIRRLHKLNTYRNRHQTNGFNHKFMQGLNGVPDSNNGKYAQNNVYNQGVSNIGVAPNVSYQGAIPNVAGQQRPSYNTYNGVALNAHGTATNGASKTANTNNYGGPTNHSANAGNLFGQVANVGNLSGQVSNTGNLSGQVANTEASREVANTVNELEQVANVGKIPAKETTVAKVTNVSLPVVPGMQTELLTPPNSVSPKTHGKDPTSEKNPADNSKITSNASSIDIHSIVDQNGIVSFLCNICKDEIESVDALEKHHEEVHFIEMEVDSENYKIKVTKDESYNTVTTQDNDVNSLTENNTSRSPRKNSPKRLPESKGSAKGQKGSFKGQPLSTTGQIKSHQDDHNSNPNVQMKAMETAFYQRFLRILKAGQSNLVTSSGK